MLCQKRNAVVVENKFHAFSLIEILISLSLATIILFSISKLYSDFYASQKKQSELLMLQRESFQLLTYLKQHIQHIGYQGSFRENSNYPLFQNQSKNYALVNPSCLIFFYDVNRDGCIGNRAKTQSCMIGILNNTKEINKEIFGFKLENQALYIYEDNSVQQCTLNICKQLLTTCNKGKWRKIDNNDYLITQLNFIWLKFEKIMKIEMELISKQQPEIRYQGVGYSYLLNAGDQDETVSGK
ncbi:hypothetical protein B0187_08625 [Haemophilus paracuniculus]|uniref:Type II secretory pathway, component PulJ n=1 Tax=Haemophilus paracuniculus TaxID=734 RepID=A0A1T0AQV8_9PAST|nr:hypothetical protein [Haemophilus paracuniculus]OOR98326.1 hypothetical protein B0187_08625 [Haemophilus paracuniculus]